MKNNKPTKAELKSLTHHKYNDWWFGKSRAERQAVKTESAAVREAIAKSKKCQAAKRERQRITNARVKKITKLKTDWEQAKRDLMIDGPSADLARRIYSIIDRARALKDE